jgi:outer membrane protein OmpA-like peptidoglycan-associated protein
MHRTLHRTLPAIMLATGLLGMGACTSLPPEKVEAIGPPYNNDVKEAYLDLSTRGPDKPYYYQKAISAFEGDLVWPRPISRWGIPEALRPEAHRYRERLVTLLEAGAYEAVPEASAEAVANFDCWMEYEAGAQTASIADPGCRDSFMTVLPELEASVIDIPPAYLVLFEPGSRELDIRDYAVIESAARMAGLAESPAIEVMGFTDRSGSSAANARLSRERADAVTETLIEMGVPAELITTAGEGAIATGDPATNRRVEIRLES